MNQRFSYLAPLAAGGCLTLLLLWLLADWGIAGLGQRSAPVAAIPAARARSRPPRDGAVPAAPAAIDFAGGLLAYLQNTLEQTDARANEAVLTFKDAAAYQDFLGRARQAGLTVLDRLDGLFTARVGYNSLAALQGDILGNATDYSAVGANYLVQFPPLPPKEDRAAVNQVPFGNSTLAFLGVTGDHSQWGQGSTIAILDSGVASGDPTFSPGQVRHLDIGLGVAPGSGDDDGHGTAVAGLAAGSAGDAPGIAPAAGILSIRVTGTDGTSDIFTISHAILAAVDAGAQIVNISMGGYETSPTLVQAIDYASAHGSIIVASAGNDQAAELTWPAADARVVSVGAVDALEQQVLFSNAGPQLQMTAPGYGVQTAWLNGERVTMDGTSASAPLVAGAIAAVMSANPGLNATEAWAILQQYASDGGAPGVDDNFGNGILNVGWAMNRNDPTRIDTAISSHYYDADAGQMEYVVQNRSGTAVAGLRLNVVAGSAPSTYSIPTLKPGAIYVVKQPVDSAALAAAGSIEFLTQLVNPAGVVDQDPANNRKSSVLTPPQPAPDASGN